MKRFKGSKHDSQLVTEFHGKPTNQLSGYEISCVKDALHATKLVRDTFMTNGKRQIPDENFSELKIKHIKTVQNKSYG